ncbi:MAG: threonine synthase [Clostridiales bacterium]|nr:threonine synthase [Clostridiales bacterium]
MSNLYYSSTRSNEEKLTFSEAVIRGIAPDGGLYVPSEFSEFDIFNKDNLRLSYQEIAKKVLRLFAQDFTDEEINACVYGAYDDKFRDSKIAPLKTYNNFSFIELYHGKTLAFKDMALSILPYLLKTAAKKLETKEKIVILAATSGDTGKAALEGFTNIEGIEIIVFYPTDGVSDVQKRQMITQTGDNTHVYGISGNFDDAQSGVKDIFMDDKLREKLKSKGYIFSSANSINIGRLVPQIIYYINSYYELVKQDVIKMGDSINIVVPTGNFGNILAAYYAKNIGLPVNKFICASNKNNVLTDFIKSSVYDLDRPFNITKSPSMDILISSNLERFLYEVSGQNPEVVSGLMESLKSNGKYEISDLMKRNMNNFYGGYADDVATIATIKSLYKKYEYVVDPHTAVAYNVYEDYVKSTGDKTHTLIASTASPYKFTRSVIEGIGVNAESYNDFELIDILSDETGLIVPEPIKGLAEREILHKSTCEKTELKEVVESILK